MKRLLCALVTLAASTVYAQSDCQATYCGSVPLLGVERSADWATDAFIRVDLAGTTWLRLRPVPADPFMPAVIIEMAPGSYFAGTYDLVAMAWPGASLEGAVVLDWASYDPVAAVEALVLARPLDVAAGCGRAVKLEPKLVGPGCHRVPRPWWSHDGIKFQLYNADEGEAQTYTVNGGPVELVLPSPLGGEHVVVVEGEAAGSSVEICFGIDPPSSGAGINTDLEIWVLPEFAQVGDRVVSTVW